MNMLSQAFIALCCCLMYSAAQSEERIVTGVGVPGGIFGKSKNSAEFYFIAPHSLRYVGRVYSFASFEDLVRELPIVGLPTYWMNYSAATHSRLDVGDLEITPLSEAEVRMIEEKCLGGYRSIPRNDDERHPALPIPPENQNPQANQQHWPCQPA